MLRLLLLLSAIATVLGGIPMRPKTLRLSPTRLGLELDPVLASALVACVVRAPSTATLVRSFVKPRSAWGLRKVLERWARVEDLGFSKLVLDSVSSQGVEWILDTLSALTRHK